MRRLRQISIVGILSLRSLHTRIRSSWVIVIALLCVIVALLSILSTGEGIKLAYLAVGKPDRAVILSAGAQSEMASSISPSALGTIADVAGIRKDSDHRPLVDPENFGTVGSLLKRSNKAPGYTIVRGISPQGLKMSPEIQIVDGRLYRPGTREIAVGVTAARKFSGLALGDKVTMLDDGEWTVVGHFSTGSFVDGDLLADPQVMAAALKRPNYNSVIVSLESPQAFDPVKRAITTDPQLSLTVERQSDYWKRQYQGLPSTPLVVAYVIGVLLAAAAVSGILHTMHATISSRAKEIAILRAVGFGGLPVAISIVVEAMIFATLGAALGTAIDWVWLNGYAMNGAYGVFKVAVTPHLLAVAIGWALVTAFVGAIVPAAQEARLTVVAALGRL
jgi:putative ABC transport system permease protein